MSRRRSRAIEARERMYRELVLTSAERVFARGGYHASKMAEVAAEAGISLGTLYGAFPSKQEVFEALHEFRGAQFLARVEAALKQPLPARESLRLGVHAFVGFLMEHEDYFRVDLREGRSWAVGDVEASPAFQAGIRQWTALMQRGIDEGLFLEDDPELMATSVFGLMQVQLAARMQRKPDATATELADSIAEALERLLCRPEELAAVAAANARTA
ncbi:MAG: TetR/AcrR family transcriptional regulator [Deltaproteobacteria bacterium]|nr:TetR/AcrR family transcriptional regulator [Deltaproteobacteria bacterium]